MKIFAGLLVLTFALCGCGGGGTAPPPPTDTEPPAATDAADLKARINQVAESGTAGSGIASIRGGIESLNKPELLKLVDSLEAADSAGDAKKVKSVAKELAGKL